MDFRAPAQLYFKTILGPFQCPGIAKPQPLVGRLNLPAIANLLIEDAIFVADSVTNGGNLQGGQGIHEACSEPAKPSVAQPRFFFSFNQHAQVDAQLPHRLFGFEPEGLPQVSFFAGLGTRFWIRDMPDDYDDNGAFVPGYQETWWTIYPYLGIEKRRTHEEGVEFYYSARIGCTPITYERVVDFNTTLYPQIGLTGQLEAGIRGRRFMLAITAEAMSWTQSDVVRDSLQPASSFTTVGLKAGFCF